MVPKAWGLLLSRIALVSVANVLVSTEVATLAVRVDGFENRSGSAGIAVWNAALGFPDHVEHAVATMYSVIEDGVAVAQFDLLAPGVYAVTVFHDENDNHRFDKNWIGIPRETWGVSNNVRPRLRAPTFDEASVTLEPGDTLVEIHVR